MRSLSGRRRIAVLVALTALVAGSVFAATAMATSSAKVVKLAIMTDCKGAFGFGYEPDIGGAQAGFAQFAGGKPTNNKKPSAGYAEQNSKAEPPGNGVGNKQNAAPSADAKATGIHVRQRDFKD